MLKCFYFFLFFFICDKVCRFSLFYRILKTVVGHLLILLPGTEKDKNFLTSWLENWGRFIK